MDDDGDEGDEADDDNDGDDMGENASDQNHPRQDGEIAEAPEELCGECAGEGAEDQIDNQSGEEEASKVKIYPIPGEPSLRERQLHETTHLPFRSWCKWCQLGKAKALPHAAADHSEDAVPTVGMDFGFISSGPDGLTIKRANENGPEDNGENPSSPEANEPKPKRSIPMILLRERRSHASFAHVLRQKGEDEYTLRRLLGDLRLLGFKRINLRCDQEPSIMQLKAMLQQAWHGEIVPEESPVGE